jgi:4-amino-4-deoxy-L-arabinose transferase-like glycosyltransferase
MIEGSLERDPQDRNPAEQSPAAEGNSARDRPPAGIRPTVARWMLAVFVLLAFGLRMYDLGGREFWFDEALTANVSGLGWQGIVAHLRTAPFEHPPFYFLTLYPWQQLAGTSEFAFRFVSVLWGVLFVPLLYILLRRWARRRLSLLAALLAVISPFLVAYSQEARMYTMLPCLAALALLVFEIALEKDHSPVWWFVYLALLVAGTATHYFFALIGVVTALYLSLGLRRGPRWRLWALAGHGLLLLAGLVWLAAAPGLRTSLALLLQGGATFGLDYKLGKIMPTLILAEVSGGEIPPTAHLLATSGWLLVLLGVCAAQRRPVLARRGRLLLLLMLVVPLVAALLLPYGFVGRHLGYTLVPLLAFLAVGLLALRRRGRLGMVLGLLLLLMPVGYGLMVHYTNGGDNFGQAMAYVDQHAQTGDLVLLSQPAQEPLVTYYNRGGWPVRYLPAGGDVLTPDTVQGILPELARLHERLWLGPIGAWTADPELLVERWLAVNAFQAQKVWFDDSSSVSLYYTAVADLQPLETAPAVWDGRIRLDAVSAGPLDVAAGEAIRLQFTWVAELGLDEGYAVSLRLVDEGGLVWADRRGEPCGGWCSTVGWRVRETQQDRHALLVPRGTPPGTYRLQVAWAPTAGGPALPVEAGTSQGQQLDLAQVVVASSGGAGDGLPEVPNPLQVTFAGEVRLVGYELDPSELRLGQGLRLETHWQAMAMPAADYVLAIDLVDGSGQVAHGWQISPFTGQYGTSQWRAGEYLRGQQILSLPGDLPLGNYRLRLGLRKADGGLLPPIAQVSGAARVDGSYLFLAVVDVLDRPRRFDLPEIPQILEARLGRRARLVGYGLDVQQAYSGGQVVLTLYWQAEGPMVQPFKVFTHLVDEQGQIVGQHDGPPGNGCCPTHTWVEGEVIIDEHEIPLRANLPAGTYDLIVGLYDEETLAPLPAYDRQGNPLAFDGVLIGAVDVQPPPGGGSVPGAQEPTLSYDQVLYLPLIAR